jgi:hypothetical protein
MTRVMDTPVRDGQAALLKSETMAGVLARMWKFGCRPLQSEAGAK